VSKSTARRPARKLVPPPKPYDGFPLTAHASGKFQKNVKLHDGTRKIVYFGNWAVRKDNQLVPVADGGWRQALKAFKAWESEQKELAAAATQAQAEAELEKEKKQLEQDQEEAERLAALKGNVEQLRAQADARAVSVGKLCNEFLRYKEKKVKSKELEQCSFDEYKQATDMMVAQWGSRTLVEELGPDDFENLRTTMLSRWKSPSRIRKFVTMTRTIFKYGYADGWIDQLPNYGLSFVPLAKKRVKLYKTEGGKKLFSRDEVLSLLNATQNGYTRTLKNGKQLKVGPSPTLHAMILLGINAGFGNTDVGSLMPKHMDFDAAIVSLPRSKTGVERSCPLWPQTIAAIEAVLATRPDSKHANVFITRWGNPWIQPATNDVDAIDAIQKQFRNLLKGLGINGRRGLGFYSLRHTLATIGMEFGDRDAVASLLGHSDPTMLSNYNHGIVPLPRRRAVSNYVRGWLFREPRVRRAK
jgi:integrase